ncbi:NACHT domain-containing protein [Pseudomonas putida]|uniref:NACHT domain-containing protein n=1 Tax=Pseudomonas putida TaxID=303 RepID=UPI0002E162AA|nr:hypothetical protein [Pseudomonas putida]
MTGHSDAFIQLNRTFSKILIDADVTDDANLNVRLGRSGTLIWSDLLAHHRVVLLAEAGSGKTEEIRNIAHRLRSEGKPAFFLRIERVKDFFEGAFEVGTYDEFTTWCRSGTEGWILMDSVDEAKLRSPFDFEVAMRKIGLIAKQAAGNAHIVITCRLSAWRPKTDLALCQGEFPFLSSSAAPARASDPASPFLLVTLDDIQGDQVDRLLDATGVVDKESFKAATERTEARALTTRPLDFLELVKFWKTEGKIGTRYELIRSSIDRRLREHDSNRSHSMPIAPKRLREGARLAALATTLGQMSDIRIPDGTRNERGLALDHILSEWTEVECEALLSRPIFDKGIYGTTRFHHRSVREYLTAEWLQHQLLNEGSRVKVEGLFFKTQYGREVIEPTLRPVLPWLALQDDRIRERAIRIAPEIFFEDGDPKQLPIESRVTILRAVCKVLAQPAHSWAVTEHAAIQLFAHTDLAASIKELLIEYRSSSHITSFLLDMVAQGEIVDAVPDAVELALNSSENRVKVAAIRAVREAGTVEDIASIRLNLLARTGKFDRECLAELIEGLPTQETWIRWLVEALSRSGRKPSISRSSDDLAFVLSGLVSTCPLDGLFPLLEGFDLLLDKPPAIDRGYCDISKRFAWLAESAATAALRILQARDTRAMEPYVLSVLRKLSRLDSYNELDAQDVVTEIRNAISTWPEMNYQLLWHDVAQTRRSVSITVADVRELGGFHRFWTFNLQNFERSCVDIAQKAELEDQLMAQSLAFHIYDEAERPSAWLEQLEAASEASSVLISNLSRLIDLRSKEIANHESREADRKQKQALRDAKEKANRRAWKERVAAEISSVLGSTTAGEVTELQYRLDREIRLSNSGSGRRAEADWASLIPEYGQPVAKAFHDGAIRFWRTTTPKLPSEGGSGLILSPATSLGLTGLAIEFKEHPDFLSQLNHAEADRAARYGLLEPYGMPAWMRSLFSHHPSTVSELALQEIESELNCAPSDSHLSVLRKVQSKGSFMFDHIAPAIISRLQASLGSLDGLRLSLNILNESSISDEAIAGTASVKASEISDPRVSATWFAAWIGTQPAEAIAALTEHVSLLESDEDRTTFLMLCLTVIVGIRHESRCRERYKTAEHAAALYLLACEHVRVEDDIDRVGKGVFSPELRDDAQDVRNNLLTFLRDLQGRQAYLALQKISQEHPSARYRSLSALFATQRATADSKSQPWGPADVADFQSRLERTPSNHHELWSLATDRLLDLKHDLENGDSSTAEILLLANQETALRKYIGNWCRERAGGRYVLPQEEQLADDKRPDFRMQSSRFDGPVPIELKLADKWTGASLFERLENQLMGDYLRDSRSSCGIFLLINQGSRSTWEAPNGRLSFDELVTALQDKWLSLAPSYPNVEDIKVIGIDLTKRGGTAAAKAVKANQAKTDRSEEE